MPVALILYLCGGRGAVLANTPVSGQHGPVVIQVGKALDGTGRILNDTRIVVRDGRIAAIDPAAEPVTYDLRGVTVMPGWIDGHVHVDWHFGPHGKYKEPETPQEAALAMAANGWATLMAGFTTIQSVGSPDDVALRNAISKRLLPGPRILTATTPLGAKELQSLTPEEIRSRVRALRDHGADVVKIFASKGILAPDPPAISQEQLDAACDEARKQGLRTVVHAIAAAVRMAGLAGCTTVTHGNYAAPEDLEMLAAKGIYFEPQAGLVLENYIRHADSFIAGGFSAETIKGLSAILPVMQQQFRRARKTPGLKVIFGSDAVAGAHGRNAEEFIYRVRDGGEAPMDAIVSATSLAAEALGLAGEIGVLAPSLQADIIAVRGDPLTDITAVRNVVFVMKNGIVHKNAARTTTQEPTDPGAEICRGAAGGPVCAGNYR